MAMRLLLLVALVCATGCRTNSPKAGVNAAPDKHGGHDDILPAIDCPLRRAGVDPKHLRPFAEVEKYIAFLDRSDRDAWQNPDVVVAALALRGHETIFDLGAGSGYFSFRLARAVPQGKVIAADTEPEMIRHIHHKATLEGLSNVKPVIIKADDPQIPSEADLAFVCDVLHHVQAPVAWLKKAVLEMKSGAKFVLIEFKEGQLPEGPPDSVKIPRAKLLELAGQAGLALESEQANLLPYQLFLVFRKGT